MLSVIIQVLFTCRLVSGFHVTCINKRCCISCNYSRYLRKKMHGLQKQPKVVSALQLAIQPEIEDFHMPDAGVHNLVIARSEKSTCRERRLSALVCRPDDVLQIHCRTNGEVNIRDYRQLFLCFRNTDYRWTLFSSGSLDMLDHASDVSSIAQLGIDATIAGGRKPKSAPGVFTGTDKRYSSKCPQSYIGYFDGYRIAVAGINQFDDQDALIKVKKFFSGPDICNIFRLVLAVDSTFDINDWFIIAWQMLGNTDPNRDIIFFSDNSMFINGTIKVFNRSGFSRKWPNIVCVHQRIL